MSHRQPLGLTKDEIDRVVAAIRSDHELQKIKQSDELLGKLLEEIRALNDYTIHEEPELSDP